MFKKRNMYIVSVVSAVEIILGLFLTQPNGIIIGAFLIAWFYFFWSLMDVFDVDNGHVLLGVYLPKGTTKSRKIALVLIALFGLVSLPGALFWAWLSK